ncbi:MAG: hypothetical protein IJ698_00415 [Prevotella sp.]|nr:hypothetical protein [Prevotella sp.]
MEVNDLMIGDWVYRPDCYDQVKEVRQNGIIGLDSARGLIPISELEPIALTTELLENNGFHLEWEGDIKLMVCNDVVIEIGNNYKRFEDGKMYLRKVLASLHYVHQLQHALRLCGIEKEIIL